MSSSRPIIQRIITGDYISVGERRYTMSLVFIVAMTIGGDDSIARFVVYIDDVANHIQFQGYMTAHESVTIYPY